RSVDLAELGQRASVNGFGQGDPVRGAREILDRGDALGGDGVRREHEHGQASAAQVERVSEAWGEEGGAALVELVGDDPKRAVDADDDGGGRVLMAVDACQATT